SVKNKKRTIPFGEGVGPFDIQRCTAAGDRPRRIERWGDGLGVRLPADIVEALGLKEGDEVGLRIAGTRAFDIPRSGPPEERDAPLARINDARWKMPPDGHFDLRRRQRALTRNPAAIKARHGRA